MYTKEDLKYFEYLYDFDVDYLRKATQIANQELIEFYKKERDYDLASIRHIKEVIG